MRQQLFFPPLRWAGVAINYNIADYLGSDTETKIALDIIDAEFGMTGNLQVMAKNVSAETADDIRDTIEAVPNVLNVNFDRYDENCYRDGNALFVVIIDGDDYSENAKLPLMKFLAASGQITDQTAIVTVSGYDSLYQTVNSKYGYEGFLPALTQAATALSGTVPQITATEEAVRQIYILYFLRIGALPNGKINGRTFAEYALATDKADAGVHSQLTDENRGRLTDMLTIAGYCSDSTAKNYDEAYDLLAERYRQQHGYCRT